MNNRFEKEGRGNLIHRALADESWSAFDARLRSDARQAFSAAKRRRRLGYLTAQAAAILLTACVLTWTLASHPRRSTATALAAAAIAEEPSASLANVITEQQMLAMFPPGSCLVAEINGEKQLVFLDPTLAREGYPLQPPGVSPHN